MTYPTKKPNEQEPERVTLDNLRQDMCAWPIGDPKEPDFHFCGEKATKGKPYCEKHCKIAYVPDDKDKKKEIYMDR